MDLDLKRVLAARPTGDRQEQLIPLTTKWGERLDPSHVRDEHPRPQLERDTWASLNGWWDYAIRESSSARQLWSKVRPPERWDGKILVPFSPEASLSGVGKQLLPTQLLWYRRTFTWDDLHSGHRLLLHFDAVDYACACYVNGQLMGTHVGGYLSFDLDITDVLKPTGNTIELCVYDPSEHGVQLRGKQRIARANMWYTAQSGIWQPVWLEEVVAAHIMALNVVPDADAGTASITAAVNRGGDVCAVDVFGADGTPVASATVACMQEREAPAEVTCTVELDSPHLWRPDDPYLYLLRVCYGADEVRSYCAFRTVGIEKDAQGVPRFCLNHEPLFVRGVLDQGYWPDGLMTAPSDAAMVSDIEAARAAGFNALRKHIKVEPERWYWHCDRLGMLVIQDMVSGGDMPREWESVNIPTLVRSSWSALPDTAPAFWRRFGAGDAAYRREWQKTACGTVARLRQHPSVVSWVVFNESWGQFMSAQMCEMLRQIDGTRPYVATSGWYDQGAGDIYAVHNYFRGMRVYRDPHGAALGLGTRSRAFAIDEFGGLTCPVEGHVSVSSTYGYDSYTDLVSWNEAFRALLARMDELEKDGLAGYVYTQLTDVEEEVNGLLTYDRRVRKWEA